MALTTQGEKALQMNALEQNGLACRLIQGMELIDTYTQGAICYGAVLFVRHLLRRDDFRLAGTDSVAMSTYLKRGSKYWKFGQHIPIGSVVLFQRDYGDRSVFHAAISCGDTYIRGVNSYKLSPWWSEKINFSNFLIRKENSAKENSAKENSVDVFTYDGKDTRVIVRY